MAGKPFLYPNVSTVPVQSGVQTDRSRGGGVRGEKPVAGEFDRVLDRLDSVKPPLKFSAHATQRFRERNISLDAEMMAKVTDAVDKADAKGVEESLILTKDAALIVNIPNRTIVTALDKSSLSGNIFTNIDGAVII